MENATNIEIFKDIKGYPDYQISNKGRLWSCKSNKYLKPFKNNKGYRMINIKAANGKRKGELIHRLVALAFIDNPEGKPEVNHINCIRCDNRVENLEWVTRKENIKYTSECGHKSNKKIQCIETGQIFNTSTEAANVNGGDSGNIRKSAGNEGKFSVYGFHYVYVASGIQTLNE